jgi:hypothetical protein
MGGRGGSGAVGGPSAGRGYPGLVIGDAGSGRHDDDMQVIPATPAPARRPVGAIVSGTLVGATLVAGGLSLAYLAFGTPMLTILLPAGRVGPGQMALGMIVMAMVLVAPATFFAVGTHRLARMLASLRPHAGRISMLQRLAPTLPPGVVGASDVTLYDGRSVPILLVGPFGALVLRESPPPAMTRVTGSSWEVRRAGGWAPMENPMERATRDAERVRHWLSHDERDFLVKTYAAVLAPEDQSVPRSSTCAVLTMDQVPAFIASLPAQRSLNASRLEGILEQVRAAVPGA